MLKLSLVVTCGTRADNQIQEGLAGFISRKEYSCTLQILRH